MPDRRPVDDCVHCGFCLPVCPTYVAWSEEMDSPRGRVDLMRALSDGKIPLNGAVVRHFDTCLGCMACLGACPSGVRYDLVVEEARSRIEREHPRTGAEGFRRWLVFSLFPYPGRLKVAAFFLWLYARSGLQWLVRRTGLLRRWPWLEQLDGLAPPMTWRHVAASLPERTPAAGTRRARVGLVAGCVQKVFFPGVNEATIRVLSAEGCEVVVPPDQGCCGALSVHGGRLDEARRMTRALVEKFETAGVDVVILNAAGCGSHLKDCGRLFAGDPAFEERARAFARKVKDVTEFLAGLAPVAPRHAVKARVAYHSPCHLGHAQGVNAQPRNLLKAVPGLELCEVPEGEHCCGSAGYFNLVEPEAANEIGKRKVENVLSTRAELVASANPGCTLHMQHLLRERGLTLPSAHPIEILDASIRGRRPGRD